jgi:hypothetical protein
VRDKRFVAEHRGGPLRKEEHHQLMTWGCDCAEHVLALIGMPMDHRVEEALALAKRWQLGRATVGEARKASVAAIRAAQQGSDTTAMSVARSVGHAVATAHMADHSLSAAWYALKAVKSSGGSVEEERRWQDGRLPAGIRELVLSARKMRNI